VRGGGTKKRGRGKYPRYHAGRMSLYYMGPPKTGKPGDKVNALLNYSADRGKFPVTNILEASVDESFWPPQESIVCEYKHTLWDGRETPSIQWKSVKQRCFSASGEGSRKKGGESRQSTGSNAESSFNLVQTSQPPLVTTSHLLETQARMKNSNASVPVAHGTLIPFLRLVVHHVDQAKDPPNL